MIRVGRDYLQVGFYTEVMFREKGVHFIAISNGVDSEKRESAKFAPFLNIMNEWYCSNYALGRQKHLEQCSSHSIRTWAVKALVLETTNRQQGKVKRREEEI